MRISGYIGRALTALGVAAAGLVAGESVAHATGLASHRAVYDLQMIEADERSGIANVVGRIVTEFSGSACDGYTLNMRRVLRVETSDGAINTFDTSTQSWESGDGSEMSFGSQLFINATAAEELAGNASRGGDGKDGAAAFELPEESVLELPPGTVFPVEHTLEIVAAALEGEIMTRSTVFDGGEVDMVYTAVTFIGEALEESELNLPEGSALAAELAGQPAWPVTVTYYEITESLAGEQLPAYEVRLTMFESGISIDLMMVYEGFTLSGTLSDVEIISQAACE